MILVTLGTQDKSFHRLLEVIEEQMELGNITDRVVVQAGHTKFVSKYMEIFLFIPMEQFAKLMETCDVLITHGGVGSIITGLQKKKVVIAVARLEEFKEHSNNHQLEIIGNFAEVGYILHLQDFAKLAELLEQARTFEPKEFISNRDNMVQLIDDFIQGEEKVK